MRKSLTISRSVVILLMTALVLCRSDRSGADEPNLAASLRKKLTAKVSEAEKKNQSAIPGDDGWMFFVPELRALTVGPFWGDDAVQVSRSSKPEYADALPAIVDFHKQLKQAGIELLVVPVPAKAAVYPEEIASVTAGKKATVQRLDPLP